MDGFDPRILEHVLHGFYKSRPNSNMVDFGVTAVDETYGRERRHRWFTFKGYKALLNRERIAEAEHELPVDLENTGGFTEMSPELFYGSQDQLHQHQDTTAREDTTKKKRKPPKNPILPDGTVKRGRPRKDQSGTNKRKREGEDPADGDGADNRPRPPKRAKNAAAGEDSVADANQGTPVTEPTPRKRGRPPKRKLEGESPAAPLRKRGRPPKHRTPAATEGQETRDGGKKTPPTAAPSVPAQDVAPETARDSSELPVLFHPEVSEHPVQHGASPAHNFPPTPPPVLELPTPEPREPAQMSQPDTNGVRRSLTAAKNCYLFTVSVGLNECSH